ncbi:hypothetical protein PQU95_16480 [Vogesella sp. DC21W]|uniref:Uncharacterized protein n=1 Tax=Vogesella aquatica TaxID=2984206 RepID=A0ABT5J1R5_9NEIS|nr:hypothetical protein [Vogesella aquatica]MDC7718798.1 hypothetical protein [Vogesella aquatica]
MPPPVHDTSALSCEFLSWARWLDTLRDAARGGDYAAVQALAKGKLRFILRRSSLLRDKAMLGILHHLQLTEAQALCQEFEQVIGELTGRIMTPANEWPLPVRLYVPEETTAGQTGGHRGQQERRHVPTRQNRLDAVSQSEAQQIYGCLRLVLRLLQQQVNLAESQAMLQATGVLARTVKLGHLDNEAAT